MKSTFEKMGGTYTLGADGIYYPNLVSTDEEPHYGKYGIMRKTYLKEHRPAMYSLYMLEDRLTEHLNAVDDEAQERMNILVRQMMERQGITEEMKARDQMEWVRAVNGIRNMAEEMRLFDIFVLIFCNSTASRLIYAYSHYNMCAGGGCMYQISNEKFGLFVTELRKKKNLTQKDLAEKLYVSDKTVSKWERGLSMPNVVLLIPIADILDVTVTELLRGEKIDTQKNIDTKEVEELVVGSLDMAVRNSIHQHRKNWILAYLLCFLISITEIIMLVVSGNSIAEMKDDILLVTGLMLLFGAWFCFFAKDILPTYYDANKINYVSQGIFRIHLVGLSFNNGNWMYICTTLKIWTLATVVLYPLAGIIIINCLNIALWDILSKIFLIMILGGMVVSIYIIGKKYE